MTPDAFPPERLRALYETLTALADDPGKRAQALFEALGDADDDEKARVLLNLTMADQSIKTLEDRRGAIPVPVWAWLDTFHQRQARERERELQATATARELRDLINAARREEQLAWILTLKEDAERVLAENQASPVSDGRTLSSDVKLVKDLLAKHEGDLRSASRTFVARITQRDSVERKSARARFKKAVDAIKAEKQG
jgi:hypothetical protein